jgi:hypothetical protein
MKQQLCSEIVDLLAAELAVYKDSILELLAGYTDFESLNIADLQSEGFEFEGSKKGVYFIDVLRSFFHKKAIRYGTSLWIITRWGGIGSFKDTPANEVKINKLEPALVKRSFNKESFGVISSLSKIASFYDHEEYFVYDSKVIYTLNWLIFKNKLSNPQFFPMPDSRSTKLTLFDLNTVINLFYKHEIEDRVWQKNLYLNTKEAYFIYCDLIKKLNIRVFPDHKPYYLEMLLFLIADNIIFNELKTSHTISIN